MSAPLIFFDSHGAAWVTCSPTERGACALGPTGAARPLTLRALARRGIVPVHRETAYGAAMRADRLDNSGEWSLLRVAPQGPVPDPAHKRHNRVRVYLDDAELALLDERRGDEDRSGWIARASGLRA